MTDYEATTKLFDRMRVQYTTDTNDGFVIPHWVRSRIVIGNTLLAYTVKGRYCGQCDAETGIFYKRTRRS